MLSKLPALPKNKPIDLYIGSNLYIYLKHRDGWAFTVLYNNYSSILRVIIRKIVKCEYITEDILQETFFKISRFIDNYDPKIGQLSTWVSCVARNCAIDELRSRAYINNLKNIRIDDHFDEVEYKCNTVVNVDAIGLKELLRFLPLAQAEIIILIYFRGYTQCEIADKFHLPLSTIKSRVRMSMIKLRKLFL
ncbi:RNA polymerase sigma factor [Pedobacter cryoconitis]|uniref:RNA polymerase sigma-70 factor (ECF subfamily) n=1 Tax=Pedobacter cryoconitis TaxID=188932 RepID=A0A327SUV4_9SPHI|nr:RNA polymerase sigma-70 factor (ECF subfamily) [Pedobacter cryoconitis]